MVRVPLSTDDGSPPTSMVDPVMLTVGAVTIFIVSDTPTINSGKSPSLNRTGSPSSMVDPVHMLTVLFYTYIVSEPINIEQYCQHMKSTILVRDPSLNRTGSPSSMVDFIC